MKKICIVEDESSLLEMYKLKFETEGYQVITASDGQAGLAAIKESQPDLVLLDLVMPRMDGYQVLQALRADPKTSKLVVYIFSNLGQGSEIEKGMAEGASGYFVKSSLTPSELALEVKKILK
jgi:DNA-binding response OmpR family regulator